MKLVLTVEKKSRFCNQSIHLYFDNLDVLKYNLPAKIYLVKVNNRNTEKDVKMFQVNSKDIRTVLLTSF